MYISDWVLLLSIIRSIIVTAICIVLWVKLQAAIRLQLISEQQVHHIEQKIEGLELQTLESKLNPHLFKNTLNAIQSHTYQTYYALNKLANILDYIMYDSKKNLFH